MESQEHLREAHELARLSSWEWRPETNAVYVFHANAPEDEVLVQVEHPARGRAGGAYRRTRARSRARISRRSPAASATRRSSATTTRMRRARCGSEHRPVGWSCGEDGELLCVRGTSQYVTQQELAKQEVTTPVLLEQVDVAVIATDPGRLVDALESRCPAAARLDRRRDGGAQRRGVPRPGRRARRRRGGLASSTAPGTGRASTPSVTRTAPRLPPTCAPGSWSTARRSAPAGPACRST